MKKLLRDLVFQVHSAPFAMALSYNQLKSHSIRHVVIATGGSETIVQACRLLQAAEAASRNKGKSKKCCQGFEWGAQCFVRHHGAANICGHRRTESCYLLTKTTG